MRKVSLIVLSMLVFGALPNSGIAQEAKYKKQQAVENIVGNEEIVQFGEASRVNEKIEAALGYHSAIYNIIRNQKQIRDNRKTVQDYDRLVQAISDSVSCNILQLEKNFNQPKEVWNTMSARAEALNTQAKIIYVNKDSLSADEINKLPVVPKEDPSSEDLEMLASVEAKGKNLESAGANQAADADSQARMEESEKISRAYWEVGAVALKEFYKKPDKNKELWKDQVQAYWTNPIKEIDYHYQSNYNISGTPTVPAAPAGDTRDQIPARLEGYIAAWEVKKDERCAQQPDPITGLPVKPAACSNPPAKPVVSSEIPELLPPWREIVYVMDSQVPTQSDKIALVYTGVEKSGAANLPEPWKKYMEKGAYLKKLQDRVHPDGEFKQMFNVNGDTVSFFMPKENVQDVDPVDPPNAVPAVANRVSAYLAMKGIEPEKRDAKDDAIRNIAEMNAEVVRQLESAGFSAGATFSLENKADYEMAVKKLAEAQNTKIKEAETMMSGLASSPLTSVKSVVEYAKTISKAMKTDGEFLVMVDRDNMVDVDRLIKEEKSADSLRSKLAEAEASEENKPVDYPINCPVKLKFR